MNKYKTEFKLKVVKSFLAGEGGAKLLARRWKGCDRDEAKIRTFGRRARSRRRCERKAMINKAHDLPVVRQVQLLELSRSSVYYQAQPTSESDLKLMRRH